MKMKMYVLAGLLMVTILTVQTKPAYAGELLIESDTEIISDKDMTGLIDDASESTDLEPMDDPDTSDQIGEADIIDQVDDTDIEADKEGENFFVIKSGTITDLTDEGKSQNELVIPESLKITVIGPNAFRYCHAHNIILPSSLREIGDNAFEGCSGLETIIIPSNVGKIGREAFKDCTSLRTVDIRPKYFKSGGRTFIGCSLSNIILPKEMTNIPASIFSHAGFGNNDLVIPKTVKVIEESAFSNITDVRSVSFEEGSTLTEIRKSAFFKYPLTHIEFPESLKVIGDTAFSRSSLESITLPVNLTSIYGGAFQESTSLKTVNYKCRKYADKKDYNLHVFDKCNISALNIDEGITYIPSYMFASADFDDFELIIPDSVTDIRESAFYDATGLIGVNFGHGSKLKTIGKEAFAFAKGYNEIILPQGLKSIGKYAFRNTDLLDVTIPKSVSKMDEPFYKMVYKDDIRFRVVNNSAAYKWLKKSDFSECIITVCSINYKLNGGINAESNPEVYTTGDVFTFSEPSRRGYDFAGWFTDSKFRNPVDGITSKDNGDKTVYAKWDIIEYKINYELNGGENVKGNKDSYIVTKAIGFKAPKRVGYKFDGWYDGPGNDALKVTKIAKGSTGDVTVYARWTPIVYKITLNAAKGIYLADTEIPKEYTIESDTIVLPVPTREGYEFLGWYAGKEGVTNIETGSAGNRKFTAKWRKL